MAMPVEWKKNTKRHTKCKYEKIKKSEKCTAYISVGVLSRVKTIFTFSSLSPTCAPCGQNKQTSLRRRGRKSTKKYERHKRVRFSTPIVAYSVVYAGSFAVIPTAIRLKGVVKYLAKQQRSTLACAFPLQHATLLPSTPSIYSYCPARVALYWSTPTLFLFLFALAL